ncbi:MAG TPA: phospholipase D-like domain-containing protein [Candidatus Acidoferrales bacterium]|nr:phospholipase D-like domain-containing protein [Candidatus Acidoferrales bacterium]
MSRELIVLPNDTPKAFLDSIAAARESLRIKMFLFSDPSLLKAVIAAHKRGVKTRVMLNPLRRDGTGENHATLKMLRAAGVEVMDSNPKFPVTHEKSMVVDSKIAFVNSLNWDTENLRKTRDYAIVTRHASEVGEIVDCFEADWHRQRFEPGKDARLIWCVGNARERIAKFIDGAKHTLWLQHERYQDPVILERLVRAKMRGVHVRVMGRPPHTLKEKKLLEGVSGMRTLADVGIKIHKLHKLKLHAKLVLADGKRAIVGSINLAPGSFDERRELAIEVDDRKIARRFLKVMEHDWKHSRPIDLSDEALGRDLERFGPETIAELALVATFKKKKRARKK